MDLERTGSERETNFVAGINGVGWVARVSASEGMVPHSGDGGTCKDIGHYNSARIYGDNLTCRNGNNDWRNGFLVRIDSTVTNEVISGEIPL